MYMKKDLFFLMVAAVSMLYVACATPESKVRYAAQKYLDATGAYDVPLACEYCTEETADGLRMIDSTLMKIVDSTYIARNMPAKIKITNLKITSDTTAVVAYHKKTPATEFDDSIDMRLRDDRWLAHKPVNIPPLLKSQHVDFHYDSVGALQEKKIN